MTLKEQFERSKSVLVKVNKNGDTLISVDRKSRFIMKDAKALLQKVEESDFDLKNNNLTLSLSGPICSKSKSYLEENRVTTKS